MPINDPKVLNEFKKKNRYCYYCKRPIDHVSPMQLDFKSVRGGYRFFHTKCFQKSGDSFRNTMSAKSTHAQISLRMKYERRDRHG